MMASKTVLWLSTLLSLQHFIATFDEINLEQIYSSDENDETNENTTNCEAIEGTVKECSECYTCGHVALQAYKEDEIVRLKIYKADCRFNVTVCCVDQDLYTFRVKPNYELCGHRNPDGYPRRLRSELRSVLQGEYPWRVWLYKISEPSKTLCAGTYFNAAYKLILTTASCVDMISPSFLQVRFDKNLTRSPEGIRVLKVAIHEDFDTDTYANDIAVLRVESAPSWAQGACLPERPAQLGTTCLAVSTDDLYINHVVQKQDKCVIDGQKALDSSFMCVAGRVDADTPELGGGLFCQDELSGETTYTVNGIYLHTSGDKKIVFGTNITHYMNWIRDTIKSLNEV